MTLDALVVGAGPVGLVMASELSRYGLSCRIVDQSEGPSIWSKAQVIHARTLEVLEDAGLLGPILERGQPVAGVNIFTPELQRIVHFSIGGIDSPFPYVLSLSQRDTELLLAEQLETQRGIRIERKVRLDGFTQDGEGVTASLVHADGRTEEVRAGYLLGCDGAHSTVRKGLGLELEGSTYPQRLLQADVRVDLPHAAPADEIVLFLGPAGLIALFPLPPGERRYRLITFLDPEGPEADAEPTLEVFQRLMAERGPKGAQVSDPAWMVDFRIHCRMVRRYRKGRAFLAGDAAHIHSPAGGQGMNTGIQDAYNLAWKLGLVRRGLAGDSLLDSYEAERRPVAEAVLRGTDTATKGLATVLGMKNPLAIELRNQLMRFVTGFGFVQSEATRNLSMIAVGYPGSPVVGEDQPSLLSSLAGRGESPDIPSWIHFGDGPAPGQRVPDMPLGEGEGRLFDLLRGTHHTLLLFDGAARTEEGYQRFSRLDARIRARLGEGVRVHAIVPDRARPEALAEGVHVLLDPEGALHRRFGARTECLYLIRPDGYVGYRCQPADEAKLEAYLDRVLRQS